MTDSTSLPLQHSSSLVILRSTNSQSNDHDTTGGADSRRGRGYFFSTRILFLFCILIISRAALFGFANGKISVSASQRRRRGERAFLGGDERASAEDTTGLHLRSHVGLMRSDEVSKQQ